jgi:hypothetical protein
MATMDDEIGRLDGLSAFELRALWRRNWKQPPPMRLSKDMLTRGLAWKLQEQTFGGIGKLELRKLAALAKDAAQWQSKNSDSGDDDNCFVDKHTSVDGVGNATSIIRKTPNPSLPAISLREGNRLVRDWNGTTHTVLVLASGFEWRGQQFGSLSKTAEAITGAHWSGPRFFGLVKRKPDRKVTAIGSDTVVCSNSEQQPAHKTTEAAGRVQLALQPAPAKRLAA